MQVDPACNHSSEAQQRGQVECVRADDDTTADR
jgi:hypothetical protein